MNPKIIKLAIGGNYKTRDGAKATVTMVYGMTFDSAKGIIYRDNKEIKAYWQNANHWDSEKKTFGMCHNNNFETPEKNPRDNDIVDYWTSLSEGPKDLDNKTTKEKDNA